MYSAAEPQPKFSLLINAEDIGKPENNQATTDQGVAEPQSKLGLMTRASRVF